MSSEPAIQLTDPDVAARFLEVAKGVASSHGGITTVARTTLIAEAFKIGVHPADIEFFIAEIDAAFSNSSDPVSINSTEQADTTISTAERHGSMPAIYSLMLFARRAMIVVMILVTALFGGREIWVHHQRQKSHEQAVALVDQAQDIVHGVDHDQLDWTIHPPAERDVPEMRRVLVHRCQQAANLCAQAQILDPSLADAFYNQIDAYTSMGMETRQFDAALQEAVDLEKTFPNDPRFADRADLLANFISYYSRDDTNAGMCYRVMKLTPGIWIGTTGEQPITVIQHRRGSSESWHVSPLTGKFFSYRYDATYTVQDLNGTTVSDLNFRGNREVPSGNK